jgi:hypothetical protein
MSQKEVDGFFGVTVCHWKNLLFSVKELYNKLSCFNNSFLKRKITWQMTADTHRAER